MTVLRFCLLERLLQALVIWPPVRLDPLPDLVVRRRKAWQVQRLAMKRVERHDAGRVLAGIKIGAVRRAVQIDHIARMRGDQHRSAQPVEEVVEALEVPVGVGQGARGGAQARREPLGHMRAGMWHRNDEGRRAGPEAEKIHQTEGSRAGVKRWNSPRSTSACTAVMSG